MCIDAPESTTISLSSGFFETSVGKKNVALSFICAIGRFSPSRMLLRGRIFLVARFPLASHPQILAHKDYVLEVHTFE